MERIDLPQYVTDMNGVIGEITGIIVSNEENGDYQVEYPSFLEAYKEYIDPKDIRIKALEDELIALKLKQKPERKKRRKLLDGEIKDIKTDIRAGLGNTEIGKEYDCSDSTISRIRLELRKAGEDV